MRITGLNWSVEILGCIPVNAQRILFAGDSTDALAGLKKAFAQRNPQANWTVWLAQSPDLASGTAKDFDVILLDFQWLVLDAMGRSRLYELDLFFKPADDLEQSADRTQTVICFYQNAYAWSALNARLSGKFHNDPMAQVAREFVLSWLQSKRFEPLKLHRLFREENQSAFESWLESMQSHFQQLGVSITEAKERHCHEIEIIRARRSKGSVQRRTRLVVAMLAMAPDFADVRTKLPLASIQTHADVDVIYMERKGNIPNVSIDQPKVLIVQRQLPDSERSWQETVNRLHQKAWAVVAEWDDHPDLFAPSVRSNFDKFPWGSVRLADAVQTSTQRLADAIRKVRQHGEPNDLCTPCEDVRVFDNRLLDLPQQRPREIRMRNLKDQSGQIMIFFGALNRTAEGLALMRAINPVLKRFDQISITVLHDRQVFEAVDTPRKRFIQRLSYVDYHQCLAQCDIALLPLESHFANQCKSDIKWVECAANQVACITSPTVYGDSIEDGLTGLIADGYDAFAEHLERLIRNPELILDLAERARAKIAAERMLAQTVDARISWYERVWLACSKQ